MSTPTRWWLIRHAPVPDPLGRISGQLDVACDTSDQDDIDALRRRLPVGAVLVESGLSRCRQTAAALGLNDPRIEPDLMEQNFGTWQGQSWLQLDQAKEPGLEDFWHNPAYATPPGGESFADQCRRVARCLDRLNQDHAGRDIIAVIHAGSIRAAIAHALGLPADNALRLAVHPLSLSRLDHLGTDWRVECMNVKE